MVNNASECLLNVDDATKSIHSFYNGWIGKNLMT